DYDESGSEYLGEFECKLSEIVGSRGQCRKGELKNSKKSKPTGYITIFAEEVYQPPKWMNDVQQLNISKDATLEEMEEQLKKIHKEIVTVEQEFVFQC